jgi:hypothetical protein
MKFFDSLPRKWFWGPVNAVSWNYSDFYRPEHRSLFVYFDSWDEAASLLKTMDFKGQRAKILQFMERHVNRTLWQWRNLFDRILPTFPARCCPTEPGRIESEKT